QVQHRRHRERGLIQFPSGRAQECRHQHQVAGRGDGEELGEALDQAPDDGGKHGATREPAPVLTPITSRASAAAAAAAAVHSGDTARRPVAAPNGSLPDDDTTSAGNSIGADPSVRMTPVATAPGPAPSGTGARMTFHPGGTATSVIMVARRGSPACRPKAATRLGSPVAMADVGTRRRRMWDSSISVPAATSVARNVRVVVGGGESSLQAASATRRAAAAQRRYGGRASHSTHANLRHGAPRVKGLVGQSAAAAASDVVAEDFYVFFSGLAPSAVEPFEGFELAGDPLPLGRESVT